MHPKLLNFIRNYYRLPLKLRAALLLYYLKRFLHLGASEKEKGLTLYFDMLIAINGTCASESSNELITSFAPDIKIISRKPVSSDILVLGQIFVNKQYQPVINLMLKENVLRQDNLKIIDAGANVGYSSLFFKKEFPNAQIMALEPEPSNFSLLKRNIELNNYNDFILLKAGLWKNEAYLEMANDFGDRLEWSYYVKEVSWPTELKGYTASDLLKKYDWESIDLFKIDIEGTEKYLFEDQKQASDFLSKTKFIVIEIHEESGMKDKIIKCFTDNQFEFFTKGALTIGKNKNIIS